MEGEEDGVTGLRRYGGTGIKTDGQARGWKRESFTHMPLKKSYQLRTRHKKVSHHLHAMHPKFIDTHAILDGFCYMPLKKLPVTYTP
jgi:hypothetical protein